MSFPMMKLNKHSTDRA